MYARLDAFSVRLQWLGLKNRSAIGLGLDRMLPSGDPRALRTLAEVVEPVKDYQRMDSLKSAWDFRAPLVRLVDVVRPESEPARIFTESVQEYLRSGRKDRVAESRIRSALVAWRDNDARLRPFLEQSFLLQELEPLSADLSATGAAGLFALDYLENSAPSPAAWRNQHLAALDSASSAKADLLLMVIPPVRQLVEASAAPTQAQVPAPR